MPVLVAGPPFDLVHMIADAGEDLVHGVAVDPSGNIYLAGYTESPDFETTDEAFLAKCPESRCAFVRKLSPEGAVLVSTLLPTRPRSDPRVVHLAVDSRQNIYVAWTGFSWADDLLEPHGAVNIAKVAPDGSRLLYLTAVMPEHGYSPVRVAVDEAGSLYVAAGRPTFRVVKVSPGGDSVVFSYEFEAIGDYAQNLSGIALGPDGSVYLIGRSKAEGFPTTEGALRPVNTYLGGHDAFLVRLKPDGSGILAATLIGGDVSDEGLDIHVDSEGNAYIAGKTAPETQSLAAMMGTQLGEETPSDGPRGFVTKINPTGTEAFFTTLLPVEVHSIAVDGGGNVFAIGNEGFGEGKREGMAVIGLSAGGATLVMRRLIPLSEPEGREEYYEMAMAAGGKLVLAGSTTSPVVPDPGPQLLAGRNAFVARLPFGEPPADVAISGWCDPSWLPPYGETNLVLQVYNHGPGPARDVAITLPDLGTAGFKYEQCFASPGGVCQTELRRPVIRYARLESGAVAEASLVLSRHSRRPEGTPWARVTASTSDTAAGNNKVAIPLDQEAVRLRISTYSRYVPARNKILFSVDGGPLGLSDTYARANSRVAVEFPDPQHITQHGSFRFTGWKDGSSENPRTFHLQDETVSATANFEFFSEPYVSPSAVVNAASFLHGAVSPGEIVTLFGFNLGPRPLATAQLDSDGRLATMLAGLQVSFDGIPAPVVYAHQTQASVIVPYSVAGRDSTEITVKMKDLESDSVAIPVGSASPSLFTAGAYGWGPAAALNQDGSLNSKAAPARPGGIIVLYGTGEGLTDPIPPDGELAGSPPPRPLAGVELWIGGLPAEILYAGGAPGLTAGLLQINARIPTGVAPGNHVSVVFAVDGLKSREGVTIAVR